jgi:hypothetical protein
MKSASLLIRSVPVWWLLFAGGALPQTIPVPQTFWRLVAQEDTNGDKKITIHDRTTPFEIRDESGADVRDITNVYQLSVLLQELKQADDRHTAGISPGQLRL